MTLVDLVLTARSGNTKTGPIPVTYRTEATCPTTCRFLPAAQGGCYGTGRIFGLAKNLLTSLTVAEAVELLGSREARAALLRDRVVGDLVLSDGSFDWPYLEAVAEVARQVGLTVFGYTHAWQMLTAADVRRIASLGYVLNASCETETEVRKAVRKGMPVVLTGDSWDDGELVGGRPVRSCPAETRHTNCAACGLCAVEGRKAIIRFHVHGAARGFARKTLAAI